VTEPSGLGVDQATVDAFAAHLEAFAGTLSDRERALLQHLLTSVLDPWELMRLRDPSEILAADELSVLRKLEGESEQ
jgi:hypothetical protein